MDTYFITEEIRRKKNWIERWRSKIVLEQNKEKPDERLIEAYMRSIEIELDCIDRYQKMSERIHKYF